MDNPHAKNHTSAINALPIHPMVMIVDRITLMEFKVAANLQYWLPPQDWGDLHFSNRREWGYHMRLYDIKNSKDKAR